MSNHTPGPWDVVLSANGKWWCIHEEARRKEIDSLVLAVSAKDPFVPKREDLKLAAASPDLLKALEAVEWEGHCMSYGMHCPCCHTYVRDEDNPPQHAPDCQLNQAIKKATGEK